MGRFFTFIIVVIVSLSSVTQAATVRSYAANLRTGPGMNHSIITALPQGRGMTVISRSGNWLQVRVGDRTGWMHQSTLNLTETTATAPAAGTGTEGVIRVNSANVRSGPSMRHGVISGLRNGERVRIISSSGQWHQVESGGRRGWVHRNLITTDCNHQRPDPTDAIRDVATHIQDQGTGGFQGTIPGNQAFQCALRRAREFHSQNRARHNLRSDWITLIDYDMPASSQRMVLVNLQTGETRRHNVAAGSGGISNVAESRGSATGFMRFSEPYVGQHGASLRMDGLESRNRNVRARHIVMHPAHYVTEGRHAGRSWGCPAVDADSAPGIYRRVQNGGLLYSYRGGTVCSQP